MNSVDEEYSRRASIAIRVAFGMAVGAILLLALLVITGCAAPGVSKSPGAVIAPAGTAVDKATAYVNSAEAAVQQATPHVDAAGKEDLTLATSAHKQALTSLAQAKTALAQAQTDIAAKDKALADKTAAYNALVNSWGHKFQVVVTQVATILLILAGLHFVAGIVAIFAPPPYSTIAGLVAKIVNPLGWGTWLVAEFETKVGTPVVSLTPPKA